LSPKFNKTVAEGYTSGIIEEMLDKLWMFRYFWLNEKLAQTFFAPISTCRYPNQIAKIRVFPDMEWEFKFKVQPIDPSKQDSEASNQWEKSTEAANNKIWKKGNLSLELFLKAKSGNFEMELQYGYARKIQTILDSLMEVKEFLDDISGVKEAKAAKAAAKLAGNVINDSPFSLKFDYPAIDIKGKWKLETIKEKAQIARAGEITIEFAPLIKATGEIDLIKCLDYLAVAGPVFRAVRKIKDAINDYTPLTADIWFSLYAVGSIDVKAHIALGAEEKSLDASSFLTVNVGAKLGVKAGVEVPKLSFGADTKEQWGFELEASAKGETSVIFSGKTVAGNEGIYMELSFGFGGMSVYVTGKAKAKAGSWGSFSVGVSDKPYQLLKPNPEVTKGRFYLVGNEKKKNEKV
jgi:hypothetical protein